MKKQEIENLKTELAVIFEDDTNAIEEIIKGIEVDEEEEEVEDEEEIEEEKEEIKKSIDEDLIKAFDNKFASLTKLITTSLKNSDSLQKSVEANNLQLDLIKSTLDGIANMPIQTKSVTKSNFLTKGVETEDNEQSTVSIKNKPAMTAMLDSLYDQTPDGDLKKSIGESLFTYNASGGGLTLPILKQIEKSNNIRIVQ